MVLNFIKSSYDKFVRSFSKTQSLLGQKLQALFSKPIDEETIEELEALFYEADFGVEAACYLSEQVQQHFAKNPESSKEELLNHIKSLVLSYFSKTTFEDLLQGEGPHVFLVVGVNGAGKTTSIGKISHLFSQNGKKVLLGAADTYRAAAASQLEKWAERSHAQIVRSQDGADPAAVAYDTVNAAISRNSDLVFIDTAGRLHNKTHLMQELAKIKKVIQKLSSKIQIKTLLVLDAHTGQNALKQVQSFKNDLKLDGLIMTKMDGSAKGGTLVSIAKELAIPILFLGTGEAAEDLSAFEASTYVEALFS